MGIEKTVVLIPERRCELGSGQRLCSSARAPFTYRKTQVHRRIRNRCGRFRDNRFRLSKRLGRDRFISSLGDHRLGGLRYRRLLLLRLGDLLRNRHHGGSRWFCYSWLFGCRLCHSSLTAGSLCHLLSRWCCNRLHQRPTVAGCTATLGQHLSGSIHTLPVQFGSIGALPADQSPDPGHHVLKSGQLCGPGIRKAQSQLFGTPGSTISVVYKYLQLVGLRIGQPVLCSL